jgi:hypothetical protein
MRFKLTFDNQPASKVLEYSIKRGHGDFLGDGTSFHSHWMITKQMYTSVKTHWVALKIYAFLCESFTPIEN